MCKFASAETDGNLHLIAFIKELLDMFCFSIKVAWADFWLHANFLNLEHFLVLLGSTELFFLLEPVFAEIKYFANRWICVRRNFNKVELTLFSHFEGFDSRDNPRLSTFIIYKSDLTYTNLFIDPQSLIVCQRSSLVLKNTHKA